MENLKEQATGLQKCITDNGTLKKSFVIPKQELEIWKLIKQKKNNRNESCMSDFLSLPYSPVMANLAPGSSAGESALLALDKRDSLESKLLTASFENHLGDCTFIEPVHKRGKSGSITKLQRIENCWTSKNR